MMNTSFDEYEDELMKIAGLSNIAKEHLSKKEDLLVMMELILHGLVEFQVLNKSLVQEGIEFSDPLGGLLDDDDDENDERLN